MHLRHQGGSATLNLLRGPGGSQVKPGESLTLSPQQFNLFLPTEATVAAYLPPVDFGFCIFFSFFEHQFHSLIQSDLVFSKLP